MNDKKSELKIEREKVNTNPTDGQKKAGNYRMGHININGFQITIENPKGSIRRGTDRNGKKWSIKMKYDYGYFTRTNGYDGDPIDVFIGNSLKSKKIFAIDQKINGKFDETKVMFCFNSVEDAKEGYMSNYANDWKGFWKITEVDLDTFKTWLYDGYKQRKPFFQYVEIKKNKLNETTMRKIIISERQLKEIIKRKLNESEYYIDQFQARQDEMNPEKFMHETKDEYELDYDYLVKISDRLEELENYCNGDFSNMSMQQSSLREWNNILNKLNEIASEKNAPYGNDSFASELIEVVNEMLNKVQRY